MSEHAGPTPESVDAFLTGVLSPDDAALVAARRASDDAGLPAIAVSAPQGKLLFVLARAIGARRILEIGTLGGYSTIWLARALPPVAASSAWSTPRTTPRSRGATSRAPGSPTSWTSGWARPSTPCPRWRRSSRNRSISCSSTPTRAAYAEYLEWAIRLTRPGALIVGDNVIRGGRILHPDGDADAAGVRAFLERLAADPRVEGTAPPDRGRQGLGRAGHRRPALTLLDHCVDHCVDHWVDHCVRPRTAATNAAERRS